MYVINPLMVHIKKKSLIIINNMKNVLSFKEMD